MALIKIKEIIGSSPKSFEDALKEAVKEVCQQKQNVTGAKVLDQSVTIRDGEIVEYKVNLNVAYLWKEELHQK